MTTSTRLRRRPRRPAARPRLRLRLEPLADRVTPAAGALDLTFGADGKLITPIGPGTDRATALAVQADGKVVLAGYAFNGADNDFALARFHPDGSPDLSFGGDGQVTLRIGPGRDVARGVVVQPDGRIVAAGYSFNGTDVDFALARFHPDGSLDPSFGGDGTVTTPIAEDDLAIALAIQPDGKLVAVGESHRGGETDVAAARYHPDGSLDLSFGGDGTVTTSLGESYETSTAVAVQADGRIVAAGYAYEGFDSHFALVRYLPDGSLDGSFGGGGTVTTVLGGAHTSASAVAVQADGRIVAAGGSWNGTDHDFALVRYLPDGRPDETFGEDGVVITPLGAGGDSVSALAVQADGKVVAAGSSSNGADNDFALARYLPDGSLDPAFGSGGTVVTPVGGGADFASAVALQADGRILAAGSASDGTADDFALVRYGPNGLLDRLADGTGKVTTPIGSGNDSATGLAVQADGRIIAAGPTRNGTNDDFAVARYRTDGSLDPTFGAGGRVTTAFSGGEDTPFEAAIQADGRIVVAGRSDAGDGTFDFAVARYNPDGSLDTSFDGDGRVTASFGGDDDARAMTIQADGKIVVAGFSKTGGDYDFAVARFNPDGSLDSTFGDDGKVTTPIGSQSEYATGVALQGDGKIVVAGYSWNGSNYDFAVVRYQPDGGLDSTFGNGGILTTPFGGGSTDQALGVAVQADGKIVVAGFTDEGGNFDFALARYHPNGSLDIGFDGDGRVRTSVGVANDFAHAVALQPDGKIVVGGHSFNTDFDFVVARYNPDGSLDTTFDGDGRSFQPFGTGNDDLSAVAVQADGRILAAGRSFRGGQSDFALLRVRGDNRAPVPVPTTLTVFEETPLTVAAPAYFYDPDSDPATTELLYAPAHGTLTLTPYGTFTYTPDPGFRGTDRFAYKVSDAFGGFNVGSVVFQVVPVVEVKADPALPGKRSLFVPGTAGDDTIVVKPVGTSKTTYQVTRNGSPARTYTGVTGRVYVTGLGGNDAIQLRAVTIPTVLDGGAGNDTLTGGSGSDSLTGGPGDDRLDGGAGTDRLVESGDVNFALAQGTAGIDGRLTGLGTDVLARNRIEQAELTGGPGDNRIDASAFTGRTWLRGGGGRDTLRGGASTDLLLGGDGNDDLDGGAGRDVLIGGLGADLLTGGLGDDILVGGSTAHDGNPAALNAILAEWTSGSTYATRVRHLLGTLAGGKNGPYRLTATTVFDDSGAADGLTGGLGLDWFVLSPGDTSDRLDPEQALTV